MPLITTPKLHQPAQEAKAGLPLLYLNPKKDKEKGLRAVKADNC